MQRNAYFYSKIERCIKMKYVVGLGLFVMLSFASFAQRITRAEYVERYAALAIEEMQRTGIPASIKLAQACLESADGNSELSVKSNNHFGIKCYTSWKGERTYHDDDAKNECFRVYETVLESFKDHSEFLRNGQRYASLFSYKQTDYKNWAHGLKKAGYATNPQYAHLLIKIIEDYELHKYDKPNALVTKNEKSSAGPTVEKAQKTEKPSKVLMRSRTKAQKVATVPNPVLTPPNFATHKAVRQISGRDVFKNNNVEYVILQDEETVFSLSRKLSMPAWKLFSFNDLQRGIEMKTGDVVYIQPKKAKAEKPYISHTVTSGETFNSIAQLYGVKVDKLSKLNGVDKNQELTAGSNIFVGKVSPFTQP